MKRILVAIALCLSTVGIATAQQRNGSLKGQVLDELGGAIVGVTVTAIDAKGVEKTVTTNDGGSYTINGLAPGRYALRAFNTGFGLYENAEVDVVAGKVLQLDITLKVTIEEQKVTVDESGSAVNTEPENNAGAVVLKGADIDALPDDPDDLAAALQALAGPSAGPNGGQIFIDGFTGGRLPPRSSIREIRINSNPFSAEYDRLGFGRIEILTRPGTDRYRGQASFNFNDDALNARNPFSKVSTRPPIQTRQYGANFGGPISKRKASFFVDFDKRDVDDEALVVAKVLDSNNHIVDFNQTVPIPSRRTSFSPRIDFQINANNTLVARYSYAKTTRLTGVGLFSLPSRAYDTGNTEHTIQFTETSIINKTIVNETRFQFDHDTNAQTADNSIPTIDVQEAFTGGGSQVGQSNSTTNEWELSNNTSFALGQHSLKVGGRLRSVDISQFSPQNFGGTYTFFGGGFGPRLTADDQVDQVNPGTVSITSIERYRRTQVFLAQGKTGPEIRLLGGGASQFRLSAGNPETEVRQWDFGGFGQDDWKLRPNFTLSLGLRYENQGNIDSHLNFAPRLGFAWSPGGQKSKTVVRGGYGVFYERVSENLTMQANRLNGVNQQQFTVLNPDFFPVIPSPATLVSFSVPGSVYRLANDLQAPYTLQSVISMERQLPHNLTLATSYINIRTLHVLRTRPLNAPLPGTFVPGVPGSGVRPLNCADFIPTNINPSTICNVYEYESSGRYNQNQFIVNFNSRFSRNASLNAYYVLAKANSDADGTGSLPANPYDLSTEYGRASGDIRHRFVMTGNFRAPWGISLNPFIIVQSGRPFNITLGRDINGDTLNTERPALAPAGVNCLDTLNFRCSPYGNFKLTFAPGDVMIPRNFAEGPGSTTVNLRVSKTWNFGSEGATAQNSNQQNRQGGQGNEGQRAIMGGGMAGGRGPGGGGPGGGGPGGGGAGGGRGGGGFGGGGGGFGGGGNAGSRYSLTFSLNFNNILNHTNLNNPIGNLGSSLFGTSTSTSGGFGGFGGGNAAYNRRIDAQIRFSF
ncbi:MAG TPA: TonB-dependent receptor [Pyrinomonadaceae bacterium]|nr:TonB-dependent receptor [Pyrinomonadaceae bacterium]